MDFTHEQIIELLDYARMYQQSGRHALAADAYRRAGTALEAIGKHTLARWCWQELDTELALCELARVTIP